MSYDAHLKTQVFRCAHYILNVVFKSKIGKKPVLINEKRIFLDCEYYDPKLHIRENGRIFW